MYRIVVELLQPHVILGLWVVLELYVRWRKGADSPRRLRWLVIPLFALMVITTPIASFCALGTLEWFYPPLDERPADVQAIVVLSGDIRPAEGARRKPELGGDTIYRCLRAVEVYADGPRIPVVVSGGISGAEATPPVADVMKEFLAQLGVAPADVIVENRSRSTYENALESARILRERGFERIVLVTDACHLVRAVGCFGKQGIEVVAAGCRYRATRIHVSLETILPDPSAARGLREAWHEWLGIAWYRLSGRM